MSSSEETQPILHSLFACYDKIVCDILHHYYQQTVKFMIPQEIVTLGYVLDYLLGLTEVSCWPSFTMLYSYIVIVL